MWRRWLLPVAAAAMAPRKLLTAAFIGLCLPLGLAAGTITPPGGVSDEPAHIARMAGILHGEFLGRRTPMTLPDGHRSSSSGMRIDPVLIWACYIPFYPPWMSAASLTVKENYPWTGWRNYVPAYTIAIYAPVFYLPGAAGLALGKRAGLRPFFAIYAARLAMFAAYAVLGVLALLLARRGQALIFLALSLPLSLSLGASCNPDGLLIASSALGAALTSRGAIKAGAVFVALAVLAKPPYLLLALPLLTPLPGPAGWRAPVFLRRLGLAAVSVLPAALWLAFALAVSAAPVQHAPYHPGPLWPGSPARIFDGTAPAAQLRCVLAHPLEFLAMFWRSLQHPVLLKEAAGYGGWGKIVLPNALYGLWGLAAMAALLADMLGSESGPAPADSVFLLAGIACSVLLVWLSQYLTWTMVGAGVIVGPSGRYLLPLIPMLGLALPRLRFRGAAGIGTAARCLPVLAVFATLLVLPAELAFHCYLA